MSDNGKDTESVALMELPEDDLVIEDKPSGQSIVQKSTYFKPWHRKIARLFVLRGMRPGEIAEQLGMHPGTVSQYLNHHPLLKLEIERLEKLVENRLIEAELEDYVKEEFEYMLPTAMNIIKENIGDVRTGEDPKADRGQRTKDAWEIIKAMTPKKQGDGGPTINLNQIIQTTEGKSQPERIMDITTHIREVKALRGKGKK